MEKLKDVTSIQEHAGTILNCFSVLSTLEDPIGLWQDTFKTESLRDVKECICWCPRSRSDLILCETLKNIKKSIGMCYIALES